ncbi:hypothetical protein AB0J72_36925 [Dactylosporangium sp. NPDC049742]|uniref:hypothetical protein n=1 Tax=Dactylosporangium sp. NPDC049742 TaxID=3154737 RepID=UPI00342076D0
METSATFIGNATVLLRLGAFTLLTDPNFLPAGQRAYLGYGLWSKRRLEPTLIHLGGTRILGVPLTMDAHGGVALSRLIRPRTILPIHHDDYTVMRDPLHHFERLADGLPVRTMSRGETVDLTAVSAIQ